ncbi:MAG: polysaccharide biosynthesis/export family protein [Chitinophagaceae bacterium]|nr:polysaccharide biosynthesis/export family protein [Chitinophagaceae bacterium]
MGEYVKLKRVIFLTLFLIVVLFALDSCVNSQKLVYFSGSTKSFITATNLTVEAPIQKNDLLSISVNSLNPEASMLFNGPNISATAINSVTNIGSSQPSGYLVNPRGEIVFPIIGVLKVAGITKSELASMLTKQLEDRKLLVDPIVTIRHLNFRVSVLGEVSNPGVFTVPNERLSLLEALGLAGDITIYGKKNNVLIIREDENANKTMNRVNMNTDSIFTSSFYYLRSNDIIYVEPSENRVMKERYTQLLPIAFGVISFGIIMIDRVKF